MAGSVPSLDLALDSLSSAEERYLFGEEEGGNGDIVAQNRVQLNIDRQSISTPRRSEVALLVGALGSLVLIALLIPRPPLESHQRCGLTTGGQVSASFWGNFSKKILFSGRMLVGLSDWHKKMGILYRSP